MSWEFGGLSSILMATLPVETIHQTMWEKKKSYLYSFCGPLYALTFIISYCFLLQSCTLRSQAVNLVTQMSDAVV